MLHCCGAVRPLLRDLIEAGLDAINPVQISCRGMEAEGLKRDFGTDLTFWGGGRDTQRVLPNGTPAEVREHTLHQCEVLGSWWGVRLPAGAQHDGNVSPENILAMYHAVQDFNARVPA